MHNAKVLIHRFKTAIKMYKKKKIQPRKQLNKINGNNPNKSNKEPAGTSSCGMFVFCLKVSLKKNSRLLVKVLKRNMYQFIFIWVFNNILGGTAGSMAFDPSIDPAAATGCNPETDF